MRSLSSPPAIDVDRVHVDSILGLREEYRREMACQIVHDSWHSRGFTTSYLLRVNGDVAGYASVGGAPCNPKDTVKEFFVLPAARGFSLPLVCRRVAKRDDPVCRCSHHLRSCSGRSDPPVGDRVGSPVGISAHCGTGRRLGTRARRPSGSHGWDSVSLQSAVRRHLHGGGGTAPRPGVWQLPGAGIEAHLPRNGAHPGRPMSSG